MGVISRRVLPVCGYLCVCCPGLRSRSRQPVKRYKQLTSAIFPKSQDEVPNERKISKLCEYASKNPLRIPKIADLLEQRCYKELRNEHFGSVRVIMRTYCKLISSCRDQMPLFATSVLNIITILLEQTRQDEMRKLACNTLAEFAYNQKDSTYMRNLLGLVPKLCELAQVMGELKRRRSLRAAGLQALSALVWLLGEHSQLVPEFDEIIAVTLDNYTVTSEVNGHEARGQHNWVKDAFKGDGFAAMSAMKDAIVKLSFHRESFHLKDVTNLSKVDAETPEIWSQICIQHIARLAKEATTVRHVLEPMLIKFDMEKKWLPENGVALAVLREVQSGMERTGNDQLLLAVLVRHLDHKNLVDEPYLKTSIVKIIARLARQSTPKITVLEIGAMTDLTRHLQKSFQSSAEMRNPREMAALNWNSSHQSAIEDCLIEFAKRIGDSNPILEMMAVILERLPTNELISRTTIESLSFLAHSIVYLSDEISTYQGFPEALFHQLVRTMVHPDADTRIGAHRIFAVLTVPPSICFNSQFTKSGHISNISSGFPSTALLFERVWVGKFGSSRDAEHETVLDERNRKSEDLMPERLTYLENIESGADLEGGMANSGIVSPHWLQMVNMSIGRSVSLGMKSSSIGKEIEMTAVRLSGHQVSLLFSTLWLEAMLPDNLPGSFEAIAQTYGLALLFSRTKTYGHNTLVQAFQLALSLRTYALDQSSMLVPSRRRSLYVLATSMLVLAAKVFSIPQIIPLVKASLGPKTKDPFLELLDDGRLVLTHSSQVNFRDYGTDSDNLAAMLSVSSISISSEDSNEAIVSLIVKGKPANFEGSDIANQLLQTFVPENTPIFRSHFGSDATFVNPFISRDLICFDEVLAAGTVIEDDRVSEASGIELPLLITATQVPVSPPHAMGVSQLLEAALETAGQVASVKMAPTSLSFSAVASQCEAFSADSRKKMSMVMNLNANTGSLQLALSGDDNQCTKSCCKSTELIGKWTRAVSLKREGSGQSPIFSPPWLTAVVPQEPWQTFKLPPASPYDSFLEAAGC